MTDNCTARRTMFRVVVNDLNRVPTADAGEDQTVLVESTVSLDGSGSTDPEEDPLDYLWSQVEGPEAVVLEGASTARGLVHAYPGGRIPVSARRERRHRLEPTGRCDGDRCE